MSIKKCNVSVKKYGCRKRSSGRCKATKTLLSGTIPECQCCTKPAYYLIRIKYDDESVWDTHACYECWNSYYDMFTRDSIRTERYEI